MPGLLGAALACAAAAAAVVVMSAGPAPAQEAASPPRLTVVGAGAGVARAEWTASGRSDPEQWAFGFASAVAAGAQLRRGGDPLARMDAEAIHAWLGDHCRRRPGDALSAALVRMVFAHAAL